MKKRIIVLLTVLFVTTQLIGEISKDSPVQNGYVDLIDTEYESLNNLDGGWRFTDFNGDRIITVPSIWKNEIQNGIYKLDIQLPEGKQDYSLYIRDCFTSYKLTINGKSLFDSKKASIKPRIFTFSAENNLSIILNVTDMETTYGGIKSSLFFGSPAKVHSFFYSRIFVDLLIIGALISLAFFYLSIWLVDRKGAGRLYICLLGANMIMALRFLTTYNRIILHFYDNFLFIEKVSTITTPVICMFYSFYFLQMYRYPIYSIIMRIFIGISLLYSYLIITSPLLFVYKISPIFLLFMLIAIYASIHISFIHVKTAELKRTKLVWILFLAVLIFMLSRAFMVWNGLISSQFHQFFGFLLLFQGVQNSFRYGDTFKHNAKLIQQKDDLFSRVSHSMKTPLYAIRGSLDLIKNSKNRCDEFQDRFQTMDGAVTDLVLQINDLLNLTEFEFSHQMIKTRVPINLSIQTVLIVDDQHLISTILGEQIKKIIHKVNLLRSESAAEALFLMKTNNVDFVFSDVMMPEMNGFEFVKECRKLGYLVPIYLFSAGSNTKNKEKALEVGANGYLEKPATIEQLKKITYLHLLQEK